MGCLVEVVWCGVWAGCECGRGRGAWVCGAWGWGRGWGLCGGGGVCVWVGGWCGVGRVVWVGGVWCVETTQQTEPSKHCEHCEHCGHCDTELSWHASLFATQSNARKLPILKEEDITSLVLFCQMTSRARFSTLCSHTSQEDVHSLSSSFVKGSNQSMHKLFQCLRNNPRPEFPPPLQGTFRRWLLFATSHGSRNGPRRQDRLAAFRCPKRLCLF